MRFHTVFTSALFAALVGFGAGVSCSDDALPGRPRIIATTDGEIDDRCSMVRFLLYANEWDIEGIVHCSSKFHWKGDGKSVKRHNWADEVWLDKQIDLYEKVLPKLSQHAEGFPTADALRKLVYTGNVANVGDMSHDTPGSDRIVEILLDDKPGPVYLQAWGGTNTIARALWKIQTRAPRPDGEGLGQGDHLHHPRPGQDLPRVHPAQLAEAPGAGQFPAVRLYRLPLGQRRSPSRTKSFFERPWMERNILKGHGPLCAIYEANGGAFRSEGDSPAFMHQIDVGLRSLEHPGWGGWGGRFVQEQPGSNVWRGAGTTATSTNRSGAGPRPFRTTGPPGPTGA